MKKYVAVLVSFVFIFAASVSVSAGDLYYTLEGEDILTAVTSSLEPGGNIVYDKGFTGNGLSLDGTYGLKLGDVGTTFSVSAMVNLTSAGGIGTIFFKNMGTSSSQKWTGVCAGSGTPFLWTHGDGFAWSTITSGGDNVVNGWAHVVYVEDNSVGYLYINGELVGSGGVASGSGTLYLGCTYWSADAVKGLVDEIKLFNVALSEDEVLTEYELYVDYAAVLDVPGEVIGNIELVKKIASKTVVWTSSDETVIATDGTVNRLDEDKTVVLTASIDGEIIEEFEVTVLKKPVVVNEKIILSYVFNENDGEIIHDVSGNGNHGAAYNGLVIDESGAVFDGTDDYVKMSEGVLYGSDDITITMVMQPYAAQKHVFAYGFGNTSSTGYMFLNPSQPDTNTLRFAATTGTNTDEKDVVSIPGIRLGEKAAVTVAINGSYVSMYVNGDLVMDGDIGMNVSDLGKTSSNYIGRSIYDGDPYFAGVVSEFTIYNYCMNQADVKALYGAEREYPEKADEEYITEVSFENGINIVLNTHGRNDVKVAAIVLNDDGEVAEFSVRESSGEFSITKEGTIIVFAYNEEDNVPGNIYVKGRDEDFSYEYTPKKLSVVTEKSYQNGMIIVAGYDAGGSLAGVSFKRCDIEAGEKIELNCEFKNAVEFKMIYLNNLAAMMPEE